MAEDNAKTSLKEVIQNLNIGDTGIIQGTVISIAPLKIQAINDEKLIIGQNLLYIPRHLTDYTTLVDISLGAGSISSLTREDGSHTHIIRDTYSGGGEAEETVHKHSLESFNVKGATMTIHNALKQGEKVHLLSLNHGKQYYVLDRVV